MLAKRGHLVRMYERRPDMRTATISAGRSINLAMSDRGLRALEAAGIAQEIRKISIPMRGRMIHDEHGKLTFQPYGVGEQAINSVSRGKLNKQLMTLAEQHGVQIAFDQRCTAIDLQAPSATFHDVRHNTTATVHSDLLFGADGAFSAVRAQMQITDRFNYSQSYLEHSYKELHIPPTAAGGFAMEQHALHIWPRHSFMLIALPNIDGSFTCTLFLAQQGSPSFAELREPAQVIAFFERYFPDALALMPTLVEDFDTNPESSLVTVKCWPWVVQNTCLIGDAAHAVVPFYGQGMNCGFEDCRILMDCLDASTDWQQALSLYQQYRKPDGDAIADLAVENFVEMRDRVADERFLRRKKLEALLHSMMPERFVPQYTLVTFSDHVRYSDAKRIGKENDALTDLIIDDPILAGDWGSQQVRDSLVGLLASRKPPTYTSMSPKT
jgi:kynurenine 3-monooxygenase